MHSGSSPIPRIPARIIRTTSFDNKGKGGKIIRTSRIVSVFLAALIVWLMHAPPGQAIEYFVPDDPGLTADQHLAWYSTLLDKGTDVGITDDIDGDPRPQGAGFDIGADEAPASEPWGTAPVAQAAVATGSSGPASGVVNHLLLLAVPIGAAILLARRRRGRRPRAEATRMP